MSTRRVRPVSVWQRGWTDSRNPTPDEVATALTIRPRRLAGNTGIRNPGRHHAGESADPGDTGFHRQTADRSGSAPDLATSMGSPFSMRSTNGPTLTSRVRALAARRPAKRPLVRQPVQGRAPRRQCTTSHDVKGRARPRRERWAGKTGRQPRARRREDCRVWARWRT